MFFPVDRKPEERKDDDNGDDREMLYFYRRNYQWCPENTISHGANLLVAFPFSCLSFNPLLAFSL